MINCKTNSNNTELFIMVGKFLLRFEGKVKIQITFKNVICIYLKINVICFI